MHIRQKITHAAMTLLLLTVLAIPFAAVAGLALWDLAGATRAAPTTMGALEVDVAAPIAAPTGLLVTVSR